MGSEDEVDELRAVSITLSSQNVDENGNDGILGNVGRVLDDFVTNQEDGSDILEAVAGQKETNTGSLNDITQNGLDFFVDSAFVIN